jgi:hypothetical protein
MPHPPLAYPMRRAVSICVIFRSLACFSQFRTSRSFWLIDIRSSFTPPAWSSSIGTLYLATTGTFYLAATFTILLDFHRGLVYSSIQRSGAEPGPAGSQRSKGDAVVRQSYLGFVEATLAFMVAASLTYAQAESASVVGSITDATGAFEPNAQVTTFCHVPRSRAWFLFDEISRAPIARRNSQVP